MKKWLGFIIILATFLIPLPAMAIGVSPYTANISVQANSYTELVFTVTGSNAVDLSLEGIPLTVELSHTSVVDNKITVRILGNLSLPSTVYTGYLVILDSGQQVGAGVKVNLTVNHINNQSSVALTTTVVSNSSGSGWSGGGYTNWQYVDNQPRKVSPFVPAVTNSPLPIPPTPPQYTEEPSTSNPPVQSPASAAINWGFIFAIAALAGAIGLLIYLVIKMRRRSKGNGC